MNTSRFKLRPIVLTLLALLVYAGQTLAQGSTKASLADWEARFPLLALIIILVIIVDLIFMLPIIRKLWSQ